jgi:hypothetical protein
MGRMPRRFGTSAPLLAQNMVLFPSQTQRFGPPDIVHNMRGSGLSTAVPDERPARGEGPFPPIPPRPPRFEEPYRMN